MSLVNQKILISLTAPSCAGKSYLLQYIRDDKKYPCLISSTTRDPRVGELNHKDYHFTNRESFQELISNDELIEFNEYGNNYYGVKKSELDQRFEENNIVFVILEPNGVKEYEEYSKGKDFTYFKVWIQIDEEIQIERFINRSIKDLYTSIHSLNSGTGNISESEKSIETVFKRLNNILYDEKTWQNEVEWDFWLDGENSVDYSLSELLRICSLKNVSMTKDRLGFDMAVSDHVLTNIHDHQLTECVIKDINTKYVVVCPTYGSELYKRNSNQLIKINR